jgi:hypothetical protein
MVSEQLFSKSPGSVSMPNILKNCWVLVHMPGARLRLPIVPLVKPPSPQTADGIKHILAKDEFCIVYMH